ncbi:MAG: hypothetical protein P8Z37_07925 [Acidobacteriota bacterium]|jgi:uncharacterized protein YcfL
MKTVPACILAALLVATLSASMGQAVNAEKIVVMNPRGVQLEIRKIPMAPRPQTL